MICKKCGAFNEDYLEYCEACSSPLTNNETKATAQPDEAGNLAWHFVSKPEWPHARI